MPKKAFLHPQTQARRKGAGLTGDRMSGTSLALTKWAPALLPGLAVMAIPPGSACSGDMLLWGGLTLILISVWGMPLLPDMVVGLAIPVCYIIAGLLPMNEAYAPWLGLAPWTTTGGIIIGIALQKTGLARRIVLTLLARFSRSFFAMLFILGLSGAVLPVIPMPARCVLFVSLGVTICEELHFEKKSAAATAVMLAAMFSAIGTGAMFLQDGGVYIFTQLPDTPMTWTFFLFRSGIPAFVILFASVGLAAFTVRNKWALPVRSMLREQHEKLPPMSAAEKKLLGVLLLMLLAFLTINKAHSLNIAMILMLAALTLFLPKMAVLSNDDLRAFNHSIVFMTCGAMSIGIAASHVQATQLIKEALIPLFDACGGGFSYLVSFLTGLAANFFLTPLAAISALTLPLHELATELALPAENLLIAFNLGLDQYLFPYEMTLIFFFTGTGYINLSSMTRLLGVRMALSTVLVLLIAVTFWS